MADNIAVTPGSGASIAADEIAGALHQRVKITVGADGTNDGDVSTSNPMPVVQTGALPAGTALIGKFGIDQATANANEVVVKSGSTVVTSGTAANCKVESTIAANQTITANHTAITGYGQAILDNADVTTARVLVAAVADKKFYITSILFSAAAAGSYWIEDDDAAQITCKWTLAANGGVSWSCPIDTPFKSTTANKGLKVKGSSAGVIGCMITYYTLA